MNNGNDNQNRTIRGNGKTIILRRGRKPNIQNKPNVQNRLKKYKQNNQVQNENAQPRIRGNKRHLIAKNLSTLQENRRKKQLAQEMYYQGASNSRSPLIRGNVSTPQIKNEKPPIHKRLGRKNNNPNNSPNRPRFNRNITGSNNNKNVAFRQNKIQRVINAKKRTNRSQRQNNNAGNYLQNNTQKIVLRRGRPQVPSVNPTNYTVEVKNTAAKHHAELNPRLQAEIKMIQRNSIVHEVVQPIPIHPLGSGVTKSTLNERFSHL